jgi:3-phenylpropionate/trans-cinnamate dioxygenase ferredoxin component
MGLEPDLTRVTTVEEVSRGAGRVVEVESRALAIFNVDGQYFVVDNTCPHRGGPLGDGDLDGRVVQCPWHGWAWDVTTGANVNNPAVRIGCYPVTVREGVIFVRLTP